MYRVPDGSDVHLHVQHPHCDCRHGVRRKSAHRTRPKSASGRKQSDDERGKLAGVFGYEIKVALLERVRARACESVQEFRWS